MAVAEKHNSAKAYEIHKARAAARVRAMSAAGRDIGELPAVVNAERKAKAERDFRFFCEQYFPQTFHLPWSPDHLKVIHKIERAVIAGELFAMAMPRGSGKSSLCEAACLWALVYGYHRFIALIGSDEDHAENMLDSIKVELETNDLLSDDFPEVCFPIRALDGIHQRAAGQLYQGKQTHIGWTAKEIVLPTMPDSRASGAIIRVAGITGRIRGMKHKRVDGSSVRPSLVLIDDPQTDESAASPSQCAARERVLSGAILGLAGPGLKISGLMTLTIMRKGDMADRILDAQKHPQWQGEKTKMLRSLPRDESLWARYAELRRAGMRESAGVAAADDFYRLNRAAMDAGASASWEERKNHDEISAIQHAMNLRIDRGDAAFFAEYQNDPVSEFSSTDAILYADAVSKKLSGVDRGVVPAGATMLTMFIDVQARALYWMVVAWQENFTGYVVDYGTEPDQGVEYFCLADVRRTLGDASPKAGLEGSIYAGLDRLCSATMGREWRCESGAAMRVERCLIDANWGDSTNVVYEYARRSPFSANITPSHGRYFGARTRPMGEWAVKPGDKVGMNWRMPVSSRRAVRHVLYDSNFWKTFVRSRLLVATGDPGSLSLFGKIAARHRMVAEHLCSEVYVEMKGPDRVCREWTRIPGRDNHFLDCIVGAAVAASMHGASPLGGSRGENKTQRRSYRDRLAAWKASR